MKTSRGICAAVLLGPAIAHGTTLTQTVDNQSWLNAVWGSPAAAPASGNDYVTAVVGSGILRTSPPGTSGGGSSDFAGDSLTVSAGTRLLMKQDEGQVAAIDGGTGDLTVDGGRVSLAANGGGSATLEVDQFLVTANGAHLDAAVSAVTLTIDGILSGPGDILIDYENGSNGAGRTMSFGAVGDYSGTITVSEGMRVDFGGDHTFAGALELAGTATLNVDQVLSFASGNLVDPVNGPVAVGIYQGAGLSALGANYVDAGGTIIVGTPDGDGDGLPDSFEDRIIDFDAGDDVTDYIHVLGPNDAPAGSDFDGDGASDAEEFIGGTDPTNPDSDDDGLPDGVETGTGNFVDGSDTGTNPLDSDSDNDGFSDGIEVAAGSHPLEFESVPQGSEENPRSLPTIHAEAAPDGFSLLAGGVAVPIIHDAADAKVVEIAVNLLAADIQAVGGIRPVVLTGTTGLTGPVVLAGTIGGSSFIDGLVAAGKLDVSGVAGNWESYHLARVVDPFPGIAEALVIAGSDRRGTAYGLGAISESLGVSPWTWWADVPPPVRQEIHLGGLPLDSFPPSVRFRGIFINDEDWGLQEWSEKNYESGPDEVKDIGPKSYAKIFELLLRLRANYCWPAMHPSTRAFHYYADNRQVADDYAIVMGSSHAEPMLRNNVDEWSRFTSDNGYSSDWNYANNQDAIYGYWDTRAQEAAPFDNVYTVGKRGIHDSNMVEGSTTAEKAAWLNTIFTDQRQILANRVNPAPEQVPQIFVPYKEVLSIYESGLVNVPDDVTLVWPDDNFGYIRRLSNDAEQLRAGGGGVYYHFSYWGAPADYLWVCAIPPALVWEEMTKAWQNQCGSLWVFNIGDIKPSEIPMEFALRLAWNVNAYGPDCQLAWLTEWATREFGANEAGAIASLLNDYYLLNHRRLPEHMDWKDDDPGSPASPNGNSYPLFSHVHEGDEVAGRLEALDELKQRADAIHSALPAGQQDAFYQLAVYPVRGAEAMNRKFLHTSLAHRGVAQKRTTVAAHSAAATGAYNEIGTETDHYNNAIASGKWNEMMDWRPRGLGVFNLPSQPADPGPQSVGLGVAVEGRLEPAFTGQPGAVGPIAELHAVDDATLTAPMQEATLDGRRCTWTPGTGGNEAAGAGGRAMYSFSVPEAGTYTLQFEVRTPTPDDDSWWIELDGNTPQKWNDLGVGDPVGWSWKTWDTVTLGAGAHSLVVHEREDGAAMAAIRIVTPGAGGGELGEDDRFVDFRLPEFNTITRRSFFIDLINTEAAPITWSATTDDPWVMLPANTGLLDDEQRLDVSIDWDQLPAGENLQSAIHVHQGADTIDVPVTVWNPATPPAADFIEENGAIAIEAEHFTSSTPGTDATWLPLAGMGRGDGVMIVSPTTAPSLPTPAEVLNDAPMLEYSFYLRTAGSHRIELGFLPALALNNERGRRYAVAIDGETPTIVSLSSQSGSGTTWSRSVLRAGIKGSSIHAIASPGVHSLKVWMVDPGLVLDRIVIETGDVPNTYGGLRETAAVSSGTLRIGAGETLILDGESANYRRIVNHGTLELRSSTLALQGDLVNFGTLRVIGPSSLAPDGNLANFGLLDAMTWTSPGLANYSDFGSVMDSSLFYLEEFWRDPAGVHLRVPGYEGHLYVLLRNEALAPGEWVPTGPTQAGTGVYGNPQALQFDWPADQARMFFRIEVQ